MTETVLIIISNLSHLNILVAAKNWTIFRTRTISIDLVYVRSLPVSCPQLIHWAGLGFPIQIESDIE